MKTKRPIITYSIIILCSIVFFGELVLEMTTEDVSEFFKMYGFSLESIQSGRYYTFFTSIILHGGASHLILNMVALVVFGRIVEMALGWKKYSLIILASAIVGSLGILASAIFGLIPPDVPTIGISAVVFGLMGTAMLIKPFEFIFYPYLIPIPLIFVAIIYTLYNIASFLIVLTTDATSNISYISHIAGLTAGLLFGFREEKNKRGIISILILLFLLIVVPLLWLLQIDIEQYNYLNVIMELFG